MHGTLLCTYCYVPSRGLAVLEWSGLQGSDQHYCLRISQQQAGSELQLLPYHASLFLLLAGTILTARAAPATAEMLVHVPHSFVDAAHCGVVSVVKLQPTAAATVA